MNKTIAFIGAGKMVSAIVKSLVRTNSFNAINISCCSANDGTSQMLSEQTGILRCKNVQELIAQKPDLLVLGCKPQQLDELPDSVLEHTKELLIISIMAGTTLGRLKKKFPLASNIVRSMPNTPGQIGEGITGYLFASVPSTENLEIVQKVLSSLGKIRQVNHEKDIDRITAISGSGPAYVFEFTSALENAAKEIGVEAKLAKDLARQTVIGAAKLLEKSDLNPEDLRNQVTSPNGTTQAALDSFSNDKFRDIISRAAKAAQQRSIELSNA